MKIIVFIGIFQMIEEHDHMSITKRLLCLFSVLAVLVSFTACEMPMKVVGSIPEPEETVKAFFDSVCAGKFAESDRYLSGVSLSMKKEIEGEFAQKLYDNLLKSYGYRIDGEVVAESLDASCQVEFTFLDLNLLSDDLKTASTTLGKKYVKETKEGYVEDKDGSYLLSDAGAEKVAAEALDQLMNDRGKYCSTKKFDLHLKYSGSKWLITLPDELFYAICGGFDQIN